MEKPKEKPKDYYQLLGVPRDASLSAIRRAFQKLTRGLGRGRAEAGIDELQAAYDTLSDAERRRRYDDELGRSGSSLLDWSFTRRPAAGDLRRPLAPTSLTAEIVLRPDEATTGTVLALDVPVTSACDACSGTGGSLFDCARCGGEGRVIRRMPVPVHVPPGLREGSVFQVRTDEPAVPTILLTVHLRRL